MCVGCFVDEKQSSNDKSSGSSNKSLTVRSRWKPNTHQLQLLEQHFEAGILATALFTAS